MSTGVSPARRRAAVVALVADGLLAAALVVILLNNLDMLALSVVGLWVAGAGGWWLMTEHGARRTIGAVAAVVGVVVVVAALAHAIPGSERFLLRLMALAVLVTAAAVAARRALIPEHPTVTFRRAERPARPVLLCNPWSGGGKVERFGLVAMAEELGVETVMLDHGLDLEQLAREAIARGTDCLGMAGGDGSQALVASLAVEHDLPFVCISAGTRNHFAQDLGLSRDDPRPTMAAFRDAVERRIDYARVGQRLFVNNVSLGIYATIVQEDSYRDAKVDTTATLLPQMLGQQAEPFDLQFTGPDGTEVDGSFLIMVSNNPYVLGATIDVAQRRTMESGRLGVFAVSTPTGLDAAALVALGALGQRNLSPYWHEFTTERFEVRSRSGTAFAGVDGEALELDTPLRFRVHPGGLRMYVPADNPEAVAQREARDARVRYLWTIAWGRDPVVDREGVSP